MEITLNDHRPISWNKLYSQGHWSKRARLAKKVHLLVRAEIDPDAVEIFTRPVDISVTGTYKHHPADPDNICAKLYIDGLIGWLIEDDGPDYVASVTTSSRKGKENRVRIEIK